MTSAAEETNSNTGLTESFTNDSAMMIAYERYLETSREGGLFQDEFAKTLAADKGEKLSETFGSYSAAFNFDTWHDFHKTWTVVRTKFIDDNIAPLAASGKFKQLVNLGAGFDTRAYRLDCFQAFENGSFDVDMEKNNKARQVVFRDLLHEPASHCPVHLVDIDLMDNSTPLSDVLAAQAPSFDATQPSVFLAEGLIQYLGEQKVKLFEHVSSVAAPGSVFILQFLDATGTPHTATGISPEDVTRANQSWSDFDFCKFGEDKLNFGLYPKQFEPNGLFSFGIFVKQ